VLLPRKDLIRLYRPTMYDIVLSSNSRKKRQIVSAIAAARLFAWIISNVMYDVRRHHSSDS